MKCRSEIETKEFDAICLFIDAKVAKELIKAALDLN